MFVYIRYGGNFFRMSLLVGTIVEGTVTSITNFGAFIELSGGVTGLVHISEVADAYVKDVNDYLKVKDKVKVKVINIDVKGKVGLSIKQANPSSVGSPSRTGGFRKERPKVKFNKETFEDKLAKFMKESDEKQLEFRKSTDAKRGGRGSSR